jgi:hypothetical protein
MSQVRCDDVLRSNTAPCHWTVQAYSGGSPQEWQTEGLPPHPSMKLLLLLRTTAQHAVMPGSFPQAGNSPCGYSIQFISCLVATAYNT